jgi:hypothetical protein
MQATTCFHDSVPNPILQQADFILHDPVAFHPADGMFNADTDGGDPTIRRSLWRCELPSRRCFLGLEDRDAILEEALEALILIQAAAGWQVIARFRGQTLIRRVTFTGVAQAAYMTRLSDHEEGFARVTLLLATVILLLLFGICRAMDRTFGAIMPKRGVVDPPSVPCVANIAANSAAVRAGSSSWPAKA